MYRSLTMAISEIFSVEPLPSLESASPWEMRESFSTAGTSSSPAAGPAEFPPTKLRAIISRRNRPRNGNLSTDTKKATENGSARVVNTNSGPASDKVDTEANTNCKTARITRRSRPYKLRWQAWAGSPTSFPPPSCETREGKQPQE